MSENHSETSPQTNDEEQNARRSFLQRAGKASAAAPAVALLMAANHKTANGAIYGPTGGSGSS